MVRRSPIFGIYEYFGIQRKAGKTTLMVSDMWHRLVENGLSGHYEFTDVYANFPIFLPGVNCLNNADWYHAVTLAKKEGWTHKLFLGDELNSILIARNSKDMSQADFCVYAWQMPKMDNVLLYTNNQLTGVDLIIRDATWQTIMPTFHENDGDPYITYNVIHNYAMTVTRGLRCNKVKEVQEKFDSYAQIK